MQRHLFELNDTGTQTDTGPNLSGRVEQWRWVNISGDTGGSLEIGLYPRAGDTGDGWLIVSTGLSPQLRASFDPTDTGVVVHAHGERLRVTKAGATGAGRLYVWSSENR
jgi:hypothetical protein